MQRLFAALPDLQPAERRREAMTIEFVLFLVILQVCYLAAVWFMLEWPAALVMSLIGIGLLACVLETAGQLTWYDSGYVHHHRR